MKELLFGAALITVVMLIILLSIASAVALISAPPLLLLFLVVTTLRPFAKAGTLLVRHAGREAVAPTDYARAEDVMRLCVNGSSFIIGLMIGIVAAPELPFDSSIPPLFFGLLGGWGSLQLADYLTRLPHYYLDSWLWDRGAKGVLLLVPTRLGVVYSAKLYIERMWQLGKPVIVTLVCWHKERQAHQTKSTSKIGWGFFAIAIIYVSAVLTLLIILTAPSHYGMSIVWSPHGWTYHQAEGLINISICILSIEMLFAGVSSLVLALALK